MKLRTHVKDAIAQGQREFSKSGRFSPDYPYGKLRSLSADQKRQHNRDSVISAIWQAAKESGRGQPPMVERFRAACIMVDELEYTGVPFGVGTNSRMNKELRKLLNEDARSSSDSRISRRKEINTGATRDLLRQIRRMRFLVDHFTKMPPYSD